MYSWHSVQQILNVSDWNHLHDSDNSTIQKKIARIAYPRHTNVHTVIVTPEWKILLTAEFNFIYYRTLIIMLMYIAGPFCKKMTNGLQLLYVLEK